MAEDCGVDINDFCWECMPGVSVKTGDAVFSLCTQWGKPGHDSKHSKCHVPPDKWDGERMRRRHVQRVNPGAVRSSSSKAKSSSRDGKRTEKPRKSSSDRGSAPRRPARS